MMMTTLFYIAMGLLFLAVIAAIISIFSPSTAAVAVKATAKKPDHNINNTADTIGQTTPITGGTLNRPGFTLDESDTLDITKDLIIIADGDITIHGNILVSSNTAVNITMMSKKGSITITKNALVGALLGEVQPLLLDGQSSISSSSYVRSVGLDGADAGYIRLLAPKGSLTIDGTVGAYGASNGGSGTATGTITLRFLGGRATALAGRGGIGGSLLLMASEFIRVNGKAKAGHGGEGGNADAAATNRSRALAISGEGNIGGNVWIEGAGPSRCSVYIAGKVQGGDGGNGGWAWAQNGTPAIARAKQGGQGGTVIFTLCDVKQLGVVNAGCGGKGGDSTASGALGSNAKFFSGWQGGAATATGGDGGQAGLPPTIPSTGLPKKGEVNTGTGKQGGGKGGDASATGGAGGAGGALGSKGKAGPVSATGGKGGVSNIAATPATTPTAGTNNATSLGAS